MQPRYLNPKIKWVWLFPTVSALLFIWLVGSLLALFASPTDNIYGFPKLFFPIPLLIVLLLVVGLPSYIWTHLEYVSFTYQFSETEFIIRQGVITRQTTIIPYHRIQNINTQRTLLERFLGLASLQIETAGTNVNMSEGILPGVANKDALIAEIMQKVEEAKKPKVEQSENPGSSMLSEILKELSNINHNLQLMMLGSGKLEPKAGSNEKIHSHEKSGDQKSR